MKFFILFIAFNSGTPIPEGFPNKGSYYHTAEKCQQAAARQAKNPNVSDVYCLSVEIKLP